jgi:predicted permease
VKGIRRLFRIGVGKGQVAEQVDDELWFHVTSRADDLVREGLSREAAMTQAMREFGDVSAARRELASIDERRGARRARSEWWNDVIQDARIAVRAFLRRPGFAIVVLLTLALGIGANGAIFSVVEAVLIRPLPYRDAGRLVHLWETQRNDPTDRTEASYPDFLDWREDRAVFAQLEGYNETNVTVGTDAGAERVRGGRVTPGFFRMLGAKPVLGRSFRDDEDVLDGSPAVVLSHQYWLRRTGGDSLVLGRTLLVDGQPVTVIGVLPSGFRFAPAGDAELWFTTGRSARTRGERFNHWLNVVGRLHDDVSVGAARARMTTVMQRLAAVHPETNAGRSALVIPLREQIVGPVEPTLTALFGAVAIVLLIAGANVASLMLARSIERGPEIAVRTALGASRARLIRQLVTESLVLAVAGGALGAWVASQGVKLIPSVAPNGVLDQMPHLRDVRVNGVVLAYTLVLAVVVGVGFGLAPALHVSRGQSADLLRSSGRGGLAGRGSQRLRDALVALEIACALVLVVGASLMGRSLVHLLHVDPGFIAEHVVTGRVALSGPAYRDGARQQRFFEDLVSRVRALPGVDRAGAVNNPPLQGGGTNTFRVEGQPEPLQASRPEATMRGIAGDYFQAMGIPLVEGRTFTARDDSTKPSALMLNESLARRLFGVGGAVGARLRFYAFPESVWTVIGVVGNVKTGSLDAAIPPTIYYTHLQGAESRMSFVARTRGDATALMTAVARVVKEMDPAVPLYAVATMRQQIARSPAVFARQYPLVLIGVFAIAALVLATIGVYGVIAYAVAQRTRELALRIALGATSGEIVALVLRRGIVLAGAGLLAGVPAALLLSRFLGTLLYDVTTTDLATYVAASAGIVGIALAASYVPARRATRVDPATALRAE